VTNLGTTAASTEHAASGIDLSGEIAERVNGALESAKPICVSYVDGEGRPHMSLRGSTHVHSGDQLALWIRHAEGGIAEAIRTDPFVGLLYRDSVTKTTIVFSGRAHLDDDPAVRDAVFDGSPEAERNHDPNRTMAGVALIIDLDHVTLNTVGGAHIDMSR
jgi:general stress protein 26